MREVKELGAALANRTILARRDTAHASGRHCGHVGLHWSNPLRIPYPGSHHGEMEAEKREREGERAREREREGEAKGQEIERERAKSLPDLYNLAYGR